MSELLNLISLSDVNLYSYYAFYFNSHYYDTDIIFYYIELTVDYISFDALLKFAKLTPESTAFDIYSNFCFKSYYY